MIAIQPVYWCVGRIYRKHSFLYCCVLDRVYRAVGWQRVDQIRYNKRILNRKLFQSCVIALQVNDISSIRDTLFMSTKQRDGMRKRNEYCSFCWRITDLQSSFMQVRCYTGSVQSEWSLLRMIYWTLVVWFRKGGIRTDWHDIPIKPYLYA
jgi:hypothetical protein